MLISLAQMTAVFSNNEALIPAGEALVLAELKKILQGRAISTVFQPVVGLVDGEVIGYEALSRGPHGSSLERPDQLFSAAARHNLVWEVEYLCRMLALERSQSILKEKMLFLNVDPQIIKDSRFHKGHTKELLESLNTGPGNIIFEITEKTAIDDYKSFRKILDNYKSQGYRIAIDDTGSGYSGLRTLAQTNPNFIKVDMELVRHIDKDGLKQAMLRALQDFSVITNSKIIAEGIETEDELATLIHIGIPYGQGYFLQRPSPGFIGISPEVKKLIQERNEQKRRELFHTPLTIPIGDIARLDTPFEPVTAGYKLLDFFNNHPNIMGVPIVADRRPVGLIMKQRFLGHLATQYGVAVYMNRPIRLLMDRNPLIVEYDTPLEQVSKSALSRCDENIYDYIIITQEGEYYGTTTIKRLLEKTTQLELNRAKHANPLTGLPGNRLIEEELARVLAQDRQYAVLYFDLDNFKAYNDSYGFDNGDKILCFTAQIIQQYLQQLPDNLSFIGHIGGDDFIAVISDAADITALCEKIISCFDSRITEFYGDDDRNKGYITVKNRHGVEENYPLIGLSIAVVTNNCHSYATPAALGEAAGRLKKRCKLSWKSCYYID